jgi:hypothetical protein
MKTFPTKLSASLFFGILLLSVSALAKPVAQVTEVKGRAFKISPQGKTSALKLDDHLDEKTEVMVEEGGSVTLNDYFDATYHLIGGTHLKLYHQSVQLKQGKTWIRSTNKKHPLAVTTANGYVGFSKCEFIATFDQLTSRSQVLVVNGDVDFSNVLDKEMKYSVPAGSFSLIDPEVENGLPRTPTKVGLRSLEVALSEFKALPASIKEHNAPASRAIASVETEAPVKKKGEIIFLQSNRLPASISGEAHSYFQKTVRPKKAQLSDAPIRFYGVSFDSHSQPRQPASSVTKIHQMAGQAEKDLRPEVEFSQTLKNNEQNSQELQNLLRELKAH